MEQSDETPQDNLPDQDFRFLPEEEPPAFQVPPEEPPPIEPPTEEPPPAEPPTEALPPKPARGKPGTAPRRSSVGTRLTQTARPPSRLGHALKASMVFGIPILFLGFLAAGFIVKNKAGERVWIGTLRNFGLLSKAEKKIKTLPEHPRIEAFNAAQLAMGQQELLLLEIAKTITEHGETAPWEKDPALAVHDRLDGVATKMGLVLKEFEALLPWISENRRLRGESADVIERIAKDEASKELFDKINIGELKKDSPELAEKEDLRKYAELVDQLELRQYAPVMIEPSEIDNYLREAVKFQNSIRLQRARIPNRQTLTGEASGPPPEGEAAPPPPPPPPPPPSEATAPPREMPVLDLEPVATGGTSEPAPKPKPKVEEPVPPPPPLPAPEPETVAPVEPPAPAPEPAPAPPPAPEPEAAPAPAPEPPPAPPVVEPKEEPPRQMQSWSGFKPGAWVRLKITRQKDAETTEEIIDSVLLEIAPQVVLQDEIPGGEITKRPIPLADGITVAKVVIPADAAGSRSWGASETSGEETITVGTHQLPCMKVTLKGAVDAEFPQAILWLNETVPGLVVRRIMRLGADETETVEAVAFGDDPHARPATSAQVEQWIVEGSQVLRDVVDAIRAEPDGPPAPEELLEKIARARELLGRAKDALAAPDDPRTMKIEKAMTLLQNYEDRLKSKE